MTTMTPAQIDKFLGTPRHAIVGTNPLDGPPQLSPVWYVYEEGRRYLEATREEQSVLLVITPDRVISQDYN